MVVLIFCIVSLFSVLAAADTTVAPSISVSERINSEHETTLTGEWGFVWQKWPKLDAIHLNEVEFSIVELPSFISEQVADNDARFTHGIATYALNISHLAKHYQRPAIHMRSVSEAWQAWWINEQGETQFLGNAGKIGLSAKSVEIREQTYILELPNNNDHGTLVIYLSAFHYDRAGLYGTLKIEEYDAVLRTIAIDLASRAFLIGIGLFVVIQNLVFFMQRRNETALLLLSVFGLVGLLRSSFASGYVDYFVTTPAFSFYAMKFEYLLVIWPAVAALHYLCAIFPNKQTARLVAASYSLLGLATLITAFIPVSEVSYHLSYYQIALLMVTSGCLWVIVEGVRRKAEHSVFFIRSIIPLIIAIFNDIWAASSPAYGFYVTEYALFIFLFLQTQLQASRFVSALDTAEHLSQNLQQEVDRKTKLLSDHNVLLEEKAKHLEEQHDEIQLLSEIDHLTGLFNRHTLENRGKQLFNQAVSYQQPLAVVMLDLDHFKQINDQYGHGVGDECLVFTASYLRGYKLRKRDIIARYGGEELVIILTDTDLEGARDIISNLCAGLSKVPVQGDHPDIYLTASFGIADLTTSQAESIEVLIQYADDAMYRAKRNGRNCVEEFQPKSSSK